MPKQHQVSFSLINQEGYYKIGYREFIAVFKPFNQPRITFGNTNNVHFSFLVAVHDEINVIVS
ncbi:hypothetical protein [Pedobacter borealis]|uniref:hypothetical protein n=1 Tax=Pedobacter borealis TaxID=475254 RepID=UPI001FD7591F|nr:hypothetical protein [Pedobacter borealis]